jgi:purine-cytosine permease-like protein
MMTSTNLASYAVASGLTALGGWIGDPIWAALIGLAVGGVIVAAGQLAGPEHRSP